MRETESYFRIHSLKRSGNYVCLQL